jgi:trans-aconitate 2-methyltransferase
MPHEFNGEAYRKSSTHQKEWGNRIIAEFNFKGNENILDIGCGDGILTSNLAELVPHGLVLGIDSSQGMIETARKLRRSNLDFRLQDINSLDYQDEFNLVFSNATLHWVKDHRRLLENCFKALKKGGELRFNFGSDGNCMNFIKTVGTAMKLPEYSRYFEAFEWPWYFPSVDDYVKLVSQSPFKEFNVWGENADRYFPDKEALVRWVDQPSLVPFMAVVPDPDKQDFREYVVKTMVEATLQADGRCFETFRRINLTARK